jgi:hypothetical protein
MQKVPPFPYGQNNRAVRTGSRSAKGAVDFLQAHDRMASLLPAVARMARLQKDCAAILPEVFAGCEVLQFEAGKLVLSVSSAALAARLKHSLPSLQDGLAKRGWQVSAIKLKVQVGQALPRPKPKKSLAFSPKAMQAFAQLEDSLEKKPHNDALRDALMTLLQRHGRRAGS